MIRSASLSPDLVTRSFLAVHHFETRDSNIAPL